MEEFVVPHLGFNNSKFGKTGEASQTDWMMHNLGYRTPNWIIFDVMETLGCLIKCSSFGRNRILTLKRFKLKKHLAAVYGGEIWQLLLNLL